MHSTNRLWTPEARARKHLKLGPNTILAIMRHGCSILTATISRSFIKAKLIFIVLMLNGRSRSQRLRGATRSAGAGGMNTAETASADAQLNTRTQRCFGGDLLEVMHARL